LIADVEEAATQDKERNLMRETPQQYTKRILSYSEGADAMQLLESAPQKLASLLSGKSKDQISRRPAPDKWSPGEIAAHLSDTEIAVSWRVRQILGTNGISVQAFDQDAWANTFDYAHRDPQASIELFRVLRAANVALLKSVPKKLWDNYGVHQERGNESITHMTRLMAGHDLNHLRQIEAALAG
jgi:DinB family protein